MVKFLKVVIVNGEETLVEEEVEIPEIEFRVYYDDNGNVLFYTCDKLAGNFLIIDKKTYAEMRLDVKVVDGKLIKYIPGVIISKLKPNKTKGITCSKDDISIIVDSKFKNKQKWTMDRYELK